MLTFCAVVIGVCAVFAFVGAVGAYVIIIIAEQREFNDDEGDEIGE